MTIPYERYRAVLMAEEFLLALCDPKKTPGVPSQIRKSASSCLRHYPSKFHMEEVSKTAPEVFNTEFWPKEKNND